MDYREISDSADLVGLVSRYTVLDMKQLSGPCPFCGGVDRFYIAGSKRVCACRKCDFKGGALKFLSKIENVTVASAVKMLTEGGYTGQPREPEVKRDWDTPKWQREARRAIAEAVKMMPASPAEAYLRSRGIEGHHGCGYDPERFDVRDESKRPALLIPWRFEGKITAIKYRFIDELAKDKDRRFAQKRGSSPVIFGIGKRRSNILCATEGEINAMSLCEALPEFDHCSFGSQSNGPGLAALAGLDYERMVIWVDERKIVTDNKERFPDNAVWIISPGQVRLPLVNDALPGLDANDLLIAHGREYLREYVLAKLLA